MRKRNHHCHPASVYIFGLTELTVSIRHHGEKTEQPVSTYHCGHTYRIAVKVGEDEIIFEPDEERQLRAFAPAHIDKTLIAIIAGQLEKIRD